MKEIALCICYAVKNYGSMLQAYATVKYIEKSKIDYKIIRYQKKHDLGFIINSLCKLFNTNFRKEAIRLLMYKKTLHSNIEFAKKITLRNEKFNEFEISHFSNFTSIARNYKELCQIGREYSAYLVGSDQLWLPAGLSTNFYNLMFTDESALRISYATSFGVSKIPSYQKRRTADFLKRIQFLSVREQKGVEIVKEIAGKKAELVVDPTLLISTDEWSKFIPYSENIYGDYIFVYFIGNNLQHREAVKELKKKSGLKVIGLLHIDEFIPSDENIYDESPFNVGPEEFVNLIRNARYICTDSFHGTVFSIIHEKQFVVFDRFLNNSKNSTNSRISSLCSILELNERRFSSNTDIYEIENKKINYEAVNQKLNLLRDTSKNFIDDALKSIKDL